MLVLEKWHSIGNDFLISKTELEPSKIAEICDRKFGIGADQFVLIQEDRIRFFNQDGTEAEICGNAMKCITKLLYEETGLIEFNLKTKKGEVKCNIDKEGFSVINLGKALEFKEIDDGIYVNLGNPHLIIFYEPNKELDDELVKTKGLELQKKFPQTNGINVSFVQVLNKQKLLVRTFERGVGETLSCGSGSCASFVASQKMGLIEGEVKVFNKGSKKVLAFKESYHLISFNSENVILKGKGTKVAEVKIY